MKNSDEYVYTLSELGLSTLQSRVYLSLAKSRNLKAHEISQISGISRPDVYRVLNQLEEAGFVEKTISKPKEFHAISIDQCISNLMRNRIMKTAELQQKALKLTQDFKRNVEDKEVAEKFQFMLINNKDAVYAKAEKMIGSVQEVVCFMTLRRRLIAWVSNYLPVLEEALNRKVEFRIIMPKSESRDFGKTLEALMKYPNFVIRLISVSPNVGFSVWDRKELLLSTSAADTPFPHPALWSNNKTIVDLSQDYFDLVWQKNQKTKN